MLTVNGEAVGSEGLERGLLAETESGSFFQ